MIFSFDIYNVIRKSSVIILLLFSGLVLAEDCFSARWKRDKPFDFYANETRETTGTYNGGLLYLVENRHFTDDVKKLIKGSTGFLPSDLDFVLNTIPNHPEALNAYSRYEFRYKTSPAFSQQKVHSVPTYDAECLFQRAISLYPSYYETYVAWGLHYYRFSNLTKAEEKFKIALSINDRLPEANYFLGLTYLKMNKLDLAGSHADKAYSQGYPLPGLRERLLQAKDRNENK